jgi:hypothetical protein
VTYEEYLTSKKIDARAFAAAEPALYKAWEFEFSQMHPNSFTVQKLNLINPIRRKYIVKAEPPPPQAAQPDSPKNETPAAGPKPARPMMKPKPKIN